ncbi:hypothetical protein B0H17DRAFT_1207288 [Mycena rosella]|uniref:Uncharacterized protein n=1 Tax=Mycena rosella TaxID=1033263 RepID=A0AAD7D351_MYCRO|nr:hypothetical protein B0H17DRAFT_1207288 [Mycena rosella]
MATPAALRRCRRPPPLPSAAALRRHRRHRRLRRMHPELLVAYSVNRLIFTPHIIAFAASTAGLQTSIFFSPE